MFSYIPILLVLCYTAFYVIPNHSSKKSLMFADSILFVRFLVKTNISELYASVVITIVL